MADIITRRELEALVARGENMTLLDVRDTPEYEDGHLPGAVHLLIADMDRKAETLLEKDDLIITYSEDYDCPASTIAAQRLEKMGFKRVLDYKASYDDWEKAENKIER